ncbi:MAG: hypothetical protein JXM70_24255 [Pirellulales bacterium]|nr:hypothetical protein [Pirellulales bacterium]
MNYCRACFLIASCISSGIFHGGISEAAKIGTEPQIFADDNFVSAKKNLVRRVHPCRKLDRPVVEPEYPWEGGRVYVFGSVDYDSAKKQFVMWYASYPKFGARDKRLSRTKRALVNYTTSSDGINWKKPELGLYSFRGSKKNNIVWDLDSPSVIVDRADPDPTRRYKMAGLGHKGVCISFSEDGIHWREHENGALKSDDTLTWTRSPYDGEYLVFHKLGMVIRGYGRRTVFLATSKDLKSWTPSKPVLMADEIDDAWVKKPGERGEFYDMSAFPYGGQFLGIAATFRRTKLLKSTVLDQSPEDGPIHGQLIHSRDGHKWNRFEDRTPVIPNGPSKFDAGCILGMINTPVVHGDEIWVYYTAITTGHGGKMPEKRITIGRAAWRLDGFVSLDAGEMPGTLETVPLETSGNRLVVNANASKGQLAVEVLDKDGKTMAGYSADDCIAMKTDGIRQAIKWKDRDRLPAEQPIRLRFHLKNASLYSYLVK